eukprot:CAMPEP_0201552490 /NCGR_PEP_ID=MMETSP0173_2-20130828/16750_1 /ASSEMBLY_ACC=CAM_ASM_000268 /TAXON_ID=218659 /ORGANISM="Vexillifera sp., Strain DIVA3 564/2" /LENGTH=422 /DNA_ID=CAMNT_0047962987 /DNA_START=94 /DNA_END=1362 /DNA_ORIENTATION=-
MPNDASNSVAKKNANLLKEALLAANASSTDRSVVIDEEYYIFNVTMSNLFNVTLTLNGKLIASNNISAWPKHPSSSETSPLGVLFIGDSEEITFNGHGTIDGQGYDWWWYTIITAIDNRPHLVVWRRVKSSRIYDVTAENSPNWTFNIGDLLDVHVKNVTVWVDVTKQKELLMAHNHWDHHLDIPTFPLNTDGFDPTGTNILIENITVQNFDDVVAVKPCSKSCKLSSCTQNVVVRDAISYWGVGQTIGSVPPSTNINCVRDVLFENIVQHHPIKGIYIKPNPAKYDQPTAKGIIQNITYHNVRMYDPLQYAIWISTQQQCQPGGNSCTGCSFLFPLSGKCPTDPQVTVDGIYFDNVKATGALTLPGVLNCNITHPCTNYHWKDVHVSGPDIVQKDWLCWNVVDSSFLNVTPPMHCIKTDGE